LHSGRKSSAASTTSHPAPTGHESVSATASGSAGKVLRRTQSERSETTRHALVDAAISVLNEHGYTGATAALISARASVTRGALQHHFGTVQNLFVAVMRHISRDRSGTSKADVPLAGSLTERMRRLAEQYRPLYEGPDAIALLEIWLGAGHDEELRRQIDTLMKRITERRNDYWQAVLSDFALSDHEIDTLRGALVSTLRGAAIHRVFSNDRARALDQVQLFLEMAEAWLATKTSGAPRA
jgi:AcrR family transcriptional regulator